MTKKMGQREYYNRLYINTINYRVMLTSALKVLVNNPFYEIFDITFMGNEKSCQNIDCFFFFFSIKIFFNWILN